uniref:Uncharacterized protein n=1 Tax=Glossina pallidipes TaxID=7398 RepID=A0A1A9ZYS1_GLOPL
MKFNIRPLLRSVCNRFVGDFSGFVNMCVEYIRSSMDNAKYEVNHVHTGPKQDRYTSLCFRYTSPFDFSIPPFEFALPPFEFAIPPFEFALPPFDFAIPPFEFGVPPFDFAIPPFELAVILCLGMMRSITGRPLPPLLGYIWYARELGLTATVARLTDQIEDLKRRTMKIEQGTTITEMELKGFDNTDNTENMEKDRTIMDNTENMEEDRTIMDNTGGNEQNDDTDQFGSEICGIVREVTDDKSLAKEERKRL